MAMRKTAQQLAVQSSPKSQDDPVDMLCDSVLLTACQDLNIHEHEVGPSILEEDCSIWMCELIRHITNDTRRLNTHPSSTCNRC